MKPRMVFRDGYWWCSNLALKAKGATMAEAWDNLHSLKTSFMMFPGMLVGFDFAEGKDWSPT